MPRGSIDWKSQESFSRLLAAVVASQPDMKLNYKKIAEMFGQGATYDAIEGRFRIVRKDAMQLRGEVDSGDRPIASARTNSTPRKARGATNNDSIIHGRISKSANSSPTKRKSAKEIKKELLESSASPSLSGDNSSSLFSNTSPDETIVIDDSFQFDPTVSMSFDMNPLHQSHASSTGSGLLMDGEEWDWPASELA